MEIGGGRGNFLEKVSPSPSKPPPSSSKTFDFIESLSPVVLLLERESLDGESGKASFFFSLPLFFYESLSLLNWVERIPHDE